MKILHTSDWHLGRTFHGESLDTQQANLLGQIRDLVVTNKVKAIIIAGDVYDRAIPPIDSVDLLSNALRELTELTQVIVISGNHDSARRLGFGSSVMLPNLSIATKVSDISKPVILQDEDEVVAVYTVPYLNPDAVRQELSTDSEQPLERSHQAVWDAAISLVHEHSSTLKLEHPNLRTIVAGHAFVVGGGDQALSVSESERDISIGGVQSVNSETFSGIDYVALGHLHRPQQIKTQSSTVISYSGSILRYSFSEATHVKSVNLIEFRSGDAVEFTQLPLVQDRPMAVLQGTLEEVVSEENINQHSKSWVRAVITSSERPDDLVTRVRRVFPHAVLIEHSPIRQDQPLGASTKAKALQTADMLIDEFYDKYAGRPISDAERALFLDAYDTAKTGSEE